MGVRLFITSYALYILKGVISFILVYGYFNEVITIVMVILAFSLVLNKSRSEVKVHSFTNLPLQSSVSFKKVILIILLVILTVFTISMAWAILSVLYALHEVSDPFSSDKSALWYLSALYHLIINGVYYAQHGFVWLLTLGLR